jgi:transposase
MYLRTTKRRNADGSEVSYYQLAENTWDASRRCAVAKVVHNFGRADQVDGDMLRRLAKSILRVFGGEEPSATGVPGDVRIRDTRTYGGVYVLEALWKEIGIDTVLLERDARDFVEHAEKDTTEEAARTFERALFLMVANRCLSPCSKLYCWEQWLREEVFLPSAQDLELHHLYLAMDFFEKHKAVVEKAIYFKMADLMNADVDLIFYDTTSLHFEIDEEDEDETVCKRLARTYEPQRKRGHSKNGRTDAPQIVVGLAVTRDGLPVRSWVFSGETSDVTTVEKVKEDLRGWRLGRCVFVGDAGMNSEENRRKLALGNGKYILASRMRAGDEVTNDVLARQGRYKPVRDNLRVKEVTVGDGERRRRYVVCHNPTEEKRQRQHRAKVIKELEAELATLRTRDDGKLSQRARELITSGRYGKYLRETERGELLVSRAAIHDEERYDGKWVITSNDDTLTPEDLALGYKQLLRVEACWRQMKSGLKMRPVFHYRPWRIRAHISIAVLALLLERIAEIRTGETWRNLADRLEKIQVVEYDRGEARIQQTTEVRPEAVELLQKLKVALPPKIHSVAPVPPDAPAQPGFADRGDRLDGAAPEASAEPPPRGDAPPPPASAPATATAPLPGGPVPAPDEPAPTA